MVTPYSIYLDGNRLYCIVAECADNEVSVLESIVDMDEGFIESEDYWRGTVAEFSDFLVNVESTLVSPSDWDALWDWFEKVVYE